MCSGRFSTPHCIECSDSLADTVMDLYIVTVSEPPTILQDQMETSRASITLFFCSRECLVRGMRHRYGA